MPLAFIGFLISYLGDPTIWIGLSVIFFIARMVVRRKNPEKLRWVKFFIIFVGVSMGLAFITSYVFKEIFQTPRPCSLNVSDSTYSEYCLDSYSFPSGHSTTGFAVATGLFFLLRKLKPKNKLNALIFLVGILPATGRVLQGVHTIADVVGGAALGIVFSFVFYFLITRIFKNLKK